MFCQIIRSERGPLQKRGQDMQEMKSQTSFKVLFQISSHFVSVTSGYEKPVITIRTAIVFCRLCIKILDHY